MTTRGPTFDPGSKVDTGKGPVTSASELGEFAYCHTAWWLSRVQGLRSTNLQALERGRALHETHGRAARRMVRLQRTAILALSLALVLLVAGICLVVAATGGSL